MADDSSSSQHAVRRVGAREGASFTFEFEGRAVRAWPGETVGAALAAAGHVHLRDAENGDPRGMSCGIGVCWECRCVVDGRPNERVCVLRARPGMSVRRQRGLDA